jgi:hypothetical protein
MAGFFVSCGHQKGIDEPLCRPAGVMAGGRDRDCSGGWLHPRTSARVVEDAARQQDRGAHELASGPGAAYSVENSARSCADSFRLVRSITSV